MTLKEKWNNKYYKWGLTAFLTVAACIVFFFLILRMGEILGFFGKIFKILRSVTLGIVIAYLINPIVVKLNDLLQRLFSRTHEKHWKKRHKDQRYDSSKAESTICKLSKALSITLGMLFFVFLLVGFVVIIFPELYKTLTTLIAQVIGNYPLYVQSVVTFANERFSDNPEIYQYIVDAIANINENVTGMISSFLLQASSWLSIAKGFTTSVKSVFGVGVDIIVGLAVAVYSLISKDKFTGQGKKILYMMFNPDAANAILSIGRQSNKIFGGFISGKIIDSLIIGILCFIGMTIFRMPFALLVSFIIGVTNIIPFFGPFIGAIPSAILMLLYKPITCVWFVLFVFALQQLDGNVIGPKILGDSTGLSPFWVIVSILLGNGLFGFKGMLLGVPVFSLIYYIIKTLVEYKLKIKGLKTETSEYSNLDRIDPITGRRIDLPNSTYNSKKKILKTKKDGADDIDLQPETYNLGKALDEMYSRRNRTGYSPSETTPSETSSDSESETLFNHDNNSALADEMSRRFFDSDDDFSESEQKSPSLWSFITSKRIKESSKEKSSDKQEVQSLPITKEDLLDRR